MTRALWSVISNRFPNSGMVICAVLFVAASGCGHDEEEIDNTVAESPAVHIIRPELRKIVRIVGQPSFIESYERSSVFPKVTGYIEEWNVDIGDRVKKGQILATLFAPEMVEDLETKKATVKLDEQRVERTIKIVKVAGADVRAAQASLKEAKEIYNKYEAEVERWDAEVKRLKNEVDKGIVDPQILFESTDQWKASVAARSAASATIARAEADLLSRESSLEKNKVEVEVARADLSVAVSEAKRLDALVSYLKLPAPFDGVIVARNANTFDFVLPTSGDPTSMERSPHLSPGKSAAPIYVVERVDIVRIFVDIPEQDANYVHVGTKATIVAKAFGDQPIPGSVTRTSWALNIKSRTLRAEIDLPNPKSQLLPGMYAYAKVIIERPSMRTLPLAALSYSGELAYCWQLENGKAVRTEVETGASDGRFIEITGLKPRTAPEGADSWEPVSGSELVILGDLSLLAEGDPVEVLPGSDAERVAEEVPDAAQPDSPEAGTPQPVNPQPGSPQPVPSRAETGSAPQAPANVVTVSPASAGPAEGIR